MKWNARTRRHFLQGAGQAALTLPLLPSLLSRKAEAQALGTPTQKSFIGMPVYNHMLLQYNNTEAEAKATPSQFMPSFLNMQKVANPVAGKHAYYRKDLSAVLTDSVNGQVSELIDKSFNALLPKMMFLQGIDDITSAHNTGHFGNATACAKESATIKQLNKSQVQMDQVLAWSSNFYKNPNLVGNYVHFTGTQGDAAHITDGNGNEHFYDSLFIWEQPALRLASKVITAAPMYNPQTVWDKFLKNVTPTDPAAAMREAARRKTLVDTVLGDYRSLIAGPRLNPDDKRRLDRHMQLLNDSESRVMTVSATCNPTRPATASGVKATMQAHNDVIVSLIACGLNHVFLGRIITWLGGDWHAWSHAGDWVPLKQQVAAVYKDWALDLATKLDAQGLLDDSIIALPWEHGREGHIQTGRSVVTFGSGGGVLKTGQFIDYRNKEMNLAIDDRLEMGVPTNQLLANWLMAMGVPPAEFEALNPMTSPYFGKTGYGSGISNDGYRNWNKNLSEWIPLIKA